jgi:hypothetical protein
MSQSAASWNEQGTSGDRRKSTTEVFEERVRLNTEGDVYHPDFLFYTAAVGIGLAQQRIDSDDESGSSSETLDEYNFFAQLLRGKIYPTTFYASKSEELIARQFLGALRTDREDRGVTFSLRPEGWPMTFQYSESEIGQDGLSSLARDFFERDDERFRYSVMCSAASARRQRPTPTDITCCTILYSAQTSSTGWIPLSTTPISPARSNCRTCNGRNASGCSTPTSS